MLHYITDELDEITPWYYTVPMSETKGGGFDPDQMRKQFREYWTQTLDKLEDIREVVFRASYMARERLDATFLRRERDRLFQQLGEDAYHLFERGRIRAEPALREILERIQVVIEELSEAEKEGEEPPPWEQAQRPPAAEPFSEPKAAERPSARKTKAKKTTTKKKATSRKKKATKKAGTTRKKATKRKATKKTPTS